MTERLHFHFSLSCIGEGNGNPLQCSCLENPGMGEPGGLPSMGSHRVGNDWSDLAAAGYILKDKTLTYFGEGHNLTHYSLPSASFPQFPLFPCAKYIHSLHPNTNNALTHFSINSKAKISSKYQLNRSYSF